MPVACWFGGQFWRQSQSTRVGNIFLGFLLLSLNRAGQTALAENGAERRRRQRKAQQGNHTPLLELADPAWTRSVHLYAPGQWHRQYPVSRTADLGVVKQDKSSRGSVDTTRKRSHPQWVWICSGERPIGAAKGKQPNTMASCQPPPPPILKPPQCLPEKPKSYPPPPHRYLPIHIPNSRGHRNFVGLESISPTQATQFVDCLVVGGGGVQKRSRVGNGPKSLPPPHKILLPHNPCVLGGPQR